MEILRVSKCIWRFRGAPAPFRGEKYSEVSGAGSAFSSNSSAVRFPAVFLLLLSGVLKKSARDRCASSTASSCSLSESYPLHARQNAEHTRRRTDQSTGQDLLSSARFVVAHEKRMSDGKPNT